MTSLGPKVSLRGGESHPFLPGERFFRDPRFESGADLLGAQVVTQQSPHPGEVMLHAINAAAG